MARIIINRYDEIEGRQGPEPTHEQVRAELERVIASPAFVASKRCQQFLRYVCTRALNGESAALKERSIAVDVFGRKLQADLGEDTIVRVGAREVRKRLAQFYSSPDALESHLRIGLPSGSYVPEFRLAESRAIESPAPPVELVPAPLAESPSVLGKSRGGLILLLLCLAVAAIVTVLVIPARTEDVRAEFETFWNPVFRSSEPLLLLVGHPLVYHPSARAIRLSESRLPPMPVPGQRPLQVSPEELNGSDLIPVQNQYVGFGDMVVGAEVAAMLAKHSLSTRIRLASSVPFADLRQNQSLLIGAVTNVWTMELGRDWRFRFARNADMTYTIQDTQSNPPVSYRNAQADNGSVSEDYLLLSRVVRSSAGGMQIVAAGIKQFGTEAAGRVLTDPRQLGAFLKKLPAGWETKNLQLLLHVKVIGNTPDQPELVAAHIW